MRKRESDSTPIALPDFAPADRCSAKFGIDRHEHPQGEGNGLGDALISFRNNDLFLRPMASFPEKVSLV
jgi:hypothetical protein